MITMPDRDIRRLQQIVASDKPETVVEIGSHEGLSALAMLEAGAGLVHCIDIWLDPAVMAAFDRNTHGRKIIGLPGTSAFYASCWQERVDMVFIDGDHSYEAVRQDIDGWLRHLKPNGVIAGHDYDKAWPGVIQAVQETEAAGRISLSTPVDGSSVWWGRKIR